MILIALPAPERDSDQAGQAGTVGLKIPPESLQEKMFLLAVPDVFMPVTEAILAVGVGHGKFILGKQRPLAAMAFVQGRSRVRHIEHELVKDGVMAHGMIDDGIDIFGAMVVQADNG